MDDTSSYLYNSPQQMKTYANALNNYIPYNTPVNSPMAGVGQMTNSLVNGLLQNKGLANYFNNNQNQSVGAPMQLPSASLATSNAMDAPGPLFSGLFGGGSNST